MARPLPPTVGVWVLVGTGVGLVGADVGVLVGTTRPVAERTAAPQSMRPAPKVVSVPGVPRSTAVLCRMERMFPPPREGRAAFTRAAQAATWGVAIDVPLAVR